MTKAKPAKRVKKFMYGVISPNELHRALAFGGARCLCGQPAAISIKVFGEYKELLARSPEFIMKLAADNDGNVPVVEFKTGKYIRVSHTFACAQCAATAEREAAKGPSWFCVEIDRGPEATNPVASQVPDKIGADR